MLKPSLFSSQACNGARIRFSPSSHTRNSSNASQGDIPADFESSNFNDDQMHHLFDEETDWNISYDNLHLLERIAKGSYGVVYTAKLEGEKDIVAIKVQDLSESNLEEQINLLVEISLAKSFAHENIVKTFGVGRTQALSADQNIQSKVFIVMEYYERGTLRQVLEGKLSWYEKIILAKDIASGLAYIHDKKLIHRDLKTENILVSKNTRASICDFSFVCHRRSSSKSQYTYGTDEFMSPEIALATDYDTASDIFSFGIVLCELITGIPPSKTFMSRLPRNTFALDEEEVGKNVPLECPEGLEALAYQCCDIDPRKRPTAVMCVEELELIALEWRIDEHDNKSRMRAMSSSASTSPRKTNVIKDSVVDNQAEISQLYADITKKLSTIEISNESTTVLQAKEDTSSSELISESAESTNKSFSMQFEPESDFSTTHNGEDEKKSIDSHIEEKLKPMLQVMLGRLENIEQNLNKTSSGADGRTAPTLSLATPSNKTDSNINEINRISTLQAQIDELKSAMKSMSQGSITNGNPESDSTKPASPLGTLSSVVQQNDSRVVTEGTAELRSQDLNGKWSVDFEDTNTRSNGELSVHRSAPFTPLARSQKHELRRSQSIEFSELHSMGHHHRQHSDDFSEHTARSADYSESPEADPHGLQIVEHLAYTIDKQPLHVREKIFHRSSGASTDPFSRKSASHLQGTRGTSRNKASEQLSKALGSFLEVISRCNQTSTAAMDAVSSVDSVVMGMKTPIQPAVDFVPLSSSSSSSSYNVRGSELVALDNDPNYAGEMTQHSLIAIETNNNFENYDGESSDYPPQYSPRNIKGRLINNNGKKFRSSSAKLSHEPNENYIQRQQISNQRKEPTSQSLRRSMSFQQPPMTNAARARMNYNNRQKSASGLPHYATATKTSIAALSSPRHASVIDISTQLRSSTTPTRSRAAKSPVPSSSAGGGSASGRVRQENEWSGKESLSTRKNPLAFSFPSDSKPKLGIDVSSNLRSRISPTRDLSRGIDMNVNHQNKSAVSVPLSTVANRR